MHIIIPMSGKGQRFIDAGYEEPKPLIKVDGKPIIEHIIERFTEVSCSDFHLSVNYKGKILIKSPNDLLINKKKVSGILQETLIKNDKRFIVVGIGINLIKSPKIRFYPTTSLFELTNMKIEMNEAAIKLKQIYEKFIPVIQKFNIKNIDKI